MTSCVNLHNSKTTNLSARRGYDNRSPEQRDKQRAHYAWIKHVRKL